MEHDTKDVFDRITEQYFTPIRIGSRCLSHIFYRVEYITKEELISIARQIAERVSSVCSPQTPELLLSLPGNETDLDKYLAVELGSPESPLKVLQYPSLTKDDRAMIRHKRVILVNDVITTARSCLEAHSNITMDKASVLCWAALVDRTFGPGPVPVVTAFTGQPVKIIA